MPNEILKTFPEAVKEIRKDYHSKAESGWFKGLKDNKDND